MVIVISMALPFYSFAWGKKGHGIVAEIAFAYLDKNAKEAVTKILAGMSVEEAGSWMDEVRGDHKYDYMKTWHYVNIDKGSQYSASKKDDNIINALNNAIAELEHKDKLSEEDIKKNLLIIFHLAGDLHMPLHVGYGNDKGGNDVQVKYLGHPSNLHRVWDTEIIESEKITANDCLLLQKNFSKDEIASLKVINVEEWIHEPRALLNKVYNLPPDNAIDQDYVNKNKPVVEQQLLIAGIRLSAVLEHLFSNRS